MMDESCMKQLPFDAAIGRVTDYAGISIKFIVSIEYL